MANIFITCLSNDSVCISSIFLLVKTKGNSKYILYLYHLYPASVLIVLNVKLC